jgi:UDP-N-acetylglucosamine 2-epimerase (non-hydrolysing)
MSVVKPKIVFVAGTLAEVIKISPVVRILKKRIEDEELQRLIAVETIITGQHPKLWSKCNAFTPDKVLECKVDRGIGTAGLVGSLVSQLANEFDPDCRLVVVHGDTVSCLAGATTAYLQGIPTAHVEAGLRLYDNFGQWPEEGIRQMVSRTAAINFAPTKTAVRNLRRELVTGRIVYTEGNTVVAAIAELLPNLPRPLKWCTDKPGTIKCLCTLHRRESWGFPMEDIVKGLVDGLQESPWVKMLVLCYPQDKVRELFKQYGSGLEERLGYSELVSHDDMLSLMVDADMLVTDSCGLVEEGTALGTFTFILRDLCERVEAVEQVGTAVIGTRNPWHIKKRFCRLVADPKILKTLGKRSGVYGYATTRPAKIIADYCLEFVLSGEDRVNAGICSLQ